MLRCTFPVDIRYHENVNVNGFDFPRSIVKLLNRTYNRVDYFCCGTGAVGFHLLHKNLANTVRFIDCFEPAIKGCQITAELNGWSDRISFAHSLEALDQQVDLFIGDPPWWPEILPGPAVDENRVRQLFDIGYATHKTMWQWLVDHLAPDGDIFIVRDNKRNNVDNWNSMIPAELKIVAEYPLKFFNPAVGTNNTQIIKLIDSGMIVQLRKTK